MENRKPSLVVSTRLAPDVRRRFFQTAAKTGGTSSTLRELVKAYVDGRVTVNPPATGTIFTFKEK